MIEESPGPETSIELVNNDIIENLDVIRVELSLEEDIPQEVIEKDNRVEKTSRFFCETCGKQFSKATYAAKHCKNEQKTWTCPNCGKQLAHITNRARHIQLCEKAMKHKVSKVMEMLKCNRCENTFSSKNNLKRHMEEVHKHVTIKIHTCPEIECQYMTDHGAQLKKHITLFHPKTKEKFLCNDCPYNCYSESGMKKHVNAVHNIANRTCNVCQQIFSSQTMMKAHVFNTHKKSMKAQNTPLDMTTTSVVVVSRKLGQHAQHSVLAQGQSASSGENYGANSLGLVSSESVNSERSSPGFGSGGKSSSGDSGGKGFCGDSGGKSYCGDSEGNSI